MIPAQTFDAGDAVALIFSETVANKVNIASHIVATAITPLGTGLVLLSNSDKTATITTGSDMTIGQWNYSINWN